LISRREVLSIEVTSKEVHDGKMLKNLVDNTSENNKVKRVLADGHCLSISMTLRVLIWIL